MIENHIGEFSFSKTEFTKFVSSLGGLIKEWDMGII